MTARQLLYERRREEARTRRRIVWTCIHLAIFTLSATFMLSRAAQMEKFVSQLRELVGQQAVVPQQPPATEQVGERSVPRQMQSRPYQIPHSPEPVAVAPAPKPPEPAAERSLGDLLNPGEENEKVQESLEWRLVFNFETGEGWVAVPGGVDASLLVIDRADNVGVSGELPVGADNAVLILQDAEAVQFEFDVEPATSLGESSRVALRVTTRNLADQEVSFRRPIAERAIVAQKRVLLTASRQLAAAVSERREVLTWWKSLATTADEARGAARTKAAALEQAIDGLKLAVEVQSRILQTYQASAELGNRLDGSATFVLRLEHAKNVAANTDREGGYYRLPMIRHSFGLSSHAPPSVHLSRAASQRSSHLPA